ncbi:hypothetical protein [Enterococcus phage vB_Efs6_KEN16]|uniref:Uncharacterized protein n=1 Tax=Enterococcus phage vB_Efs6_KEN16 TaxID=3138325 RepID=A0AAX4PU25_9CAUD
MSYFFFSDSLYLLYILYSTIYILITIRYYI